MPSDQPIKVAIVGGGCASVTAAFELTRPQHRGKYQVTIYQTGWRLGGKGASGRGCAGRIEEHGLHIWLGSYENAFQLLRECYAELGRDPHICPIAGWRDAFFSEPHVGVADYSHLIGWSKWLTHFPPAKGLPGDPFTTFNPFTIRSYLSRTLVLLRTLLFVAHTRREAAHAHSEWEDISDSGWPAEDSESAQRNVRSLIAKLSNLLKVGVLSTAAGLSEALALLHAAVKLLPTFPENLFGRLVETVVSSIRARLETVIAEDDDVRCKWEVVDLVLAFLIGAVRFRLLTDPRGLSALDDYECREWLRMNGASERALNSAFLRGLYDLALAYEDGDPARPRMAAGPALRGTLRMFFTYRGTLFWRMRSGMGDCVFAPYYEVLKKRGVRFEFFHRLENVKLCPAEAQLLGEPPYVEALEFDVQAQVDGGEYRPLIDIKGVPCWPSAPDFHQLVDGARLQREGVRFESHWDRRKTATKTLRVTRDFDFVVLGVSVGAIPFVCREILKRDARWRAMVENVKTVATQTFQIWMRQDMRQLGWTDPPVILSAFAKPFDTWADMGHVLPQEDWKHEPRSVAYFCGVLTDKPTPSDRSDNGYEAARFDEVKRAAIDFLNHQVRRLWPKANRRAGEFRWDLLSDPAEPGPVESPPVHGENRFSSQYWTANVNPTDRYVLMLPGTLRYRISPLDNTYDNMTIAGDWTDCGYNAGCVEAAVMSGRLAAHAITKWPPLEDIVGYDHP
jgi:uncharacterized protein with NAD-binding domain and iron-sulfur cluster